MSKKWICAAWLAATLFAGTASAQQPAGFDWKRYDGQTITFLSSNHPWSNAVLPHLEEFKKLTGITVRVDTYNETQMRTRLTTMLQTRSADVDIFMTLPAREGRIYQSAGWYRDLGELAADKTQTTPDYDIGDFGESLMQRAAFGGKVIGIPAQHRGAGALLPPRHPRRMPRRSAQDARRIDRGGGEAEGVQARHRAVREPGTVAGAGLHVRAVFLQSRRQLRPSAGPQGVLHASR